MSFIERKWKLLDHFNDNNLCMAQSQVHAFICILAHLILCVEREQCIH